MDREEQLADAILDLTYGEMMAFASLLNSIGGDRGFGEAATTEEFAQLMFDAAEAVKEAVQMSDD